MSCISKVRMAAVAIAAVAAIGIAAGPAQAHWGEREYNYHGYHHGWNGGYWAAPPVVYGNPYRYGYYPPPGVGINVGGVHIGIH